MTSVAIWAFERREETSNFTVRGRLPFRSLTGSHPRGRRGAGLPHVLASTAKALAADIVEYAPELWRALQRRARSCRDDMTEASHARLFWCDAMEHMLFSNQLT